jgi:hypothetical protein
MRGPPSLTTVSQTGWTAPESGVRAGHGETLTEAGQHQSAGAADLLIAATAERERLVILCYDRDYLGIAARHGSARQDHHRDLIEWYRFLSPGGQVYLIDGLCRRENQERARDRTG